MSSNELLEPLPTVLRSIAAAIYSGLQRATVGKGGGSYNWHEVVTPQHDKAIAFLRSRMEEITEGGLSIRSASQSLVNPRRRGFLTLLVVVCKPDRAEGEVLRLQPNEVLYAILVPNAVTEGMEVLKVQ